MSPRNSGRVLGSNGEETVIEERCRLLTGWDDLGKALAHESDLLGGHLNGGALHGRSSYGCCPGEVGAAKRLIQSRFYCSVIAMADMRGIDLNLLVCSMRCS